MSASVQPIAAAAPHVSWLKKIGNVVAKIVGAVVKVEPGIVRVAEIALPEFAPEIALADGLFSKALSLVVTSQGVFTAVGQASNNAGKLAAVLAGFGQEMDAYIATNFPGAKALSLDVKTKYVNVMVAIANELDGEAIATNPPASTIVAATAATIAVKTALAEAPAPATTEAQAPGMTAAIDAGAMLAGKVAKLPDATVTNEKPPIPQD
jgi:hypothetical protein